MEEQYTNNREQMDNENREDVEQNQPKYMWGSYIDNNGQTQWSLLPEYYTYFAGLLQAITMLRQTVNKKWRDQQLKAYQLFLTDLQNYINNYVLTAQVADFNVFLDAMQTYGKDQNPLGKELYDTQLDYMQKKSQGYDFKLDKKKKKPQKSAQQTRKQQAPRKPVQKKQQVIIRKTDPQINIQTLMNTEWPEDKYVNINIFKKQNVNLVFIGHVDAGKSSLTGNILKQLGQVDEQEWARNKQEAKENHMEAWELAGITDVDPSERKRGKTVQYAKVNFALENRRFTVFDAPGHKNYVPNMIMGACQADIAVLIISSKEGQFEAGFEKDGQTKQHAMLAKALGVSGFIVAVTKMSLNNWSEKRYTLIKEQVTPFLENACGFANVPFIPLDSITNLNVHKPVDIPQANWYKGKCLLDVLNQMPLPERKPLAPLRIPLIDKFKQTGSFYLYGKIESGTIIEDQTVTILPQRKQVVIRQIYNAKDQRLPFAMAGQNIKIKVKGGDQGQIKRGDVICNNSNYCQQTYQVKATINVLELPQSKKLMASGYQCILHMHAIAEQIQIMKVQAKFDPQTKKNISATFLKAGQQGTVTIKSQNLLCLEKYEFMPNLGRFTLRDQGKTVGYGVITKIKPARKLLQEQKQQLGVRKEEENKVVEKQLDNLNISN